MTNLQFVEILKKVEQMPTHYAKGTFGQQATDVFINQKAKQYPSWYTPAKVAELKALDDKTRLYDCIGLYKGELWRNASGTLIYTSNGVPDKNETDMFNLCSDKSTNFENCIPGEAVWMQGHIGFVIDGAKKLVIECTNAFTQNVCITTYDKNNKEYPYRAWTKHGKLPHLTYVTITNVADNSSDPEEFDAHVIIEKDKITITRR